jgi:hypothetical protein
VLILAFITSDPEVPYYEQVIRNLIGGVIFLLFISVVLLLLVDGAGDLMLGTGSKKELAAEDAAKYRSTYRR